MNKPPLKILWLVNIVLPAVAEDFGCERTPFGGWLTLMTERLSKLPGYDIGIAMRAPVAKLESREKDGIRYYAVPQSSTDRFDISQQDCDAVLAGFCPDILHAEGSEMAYTRRFLRSWDGLKLLSLQGVINGYEAYELGRLPIGAMLVSLDPREVLTALALLFRKRFQFNPRLALEKQTLGMVDHIMGRTQWDRAHAYALNPHASYHHCGRILRKEFHQRLWTRSDVEDHSIFIGSAGSARKGAHIALRALAQLRESFPGTRLYIAGDSPASVPRWSAKRYVGYPAYLTRLIEQLDLTEHVIFTGLLSAAEMAQRMQRSHVFNLPSLIENSPNTLGEAMLMGVPSIAAYAGGVTSMAADEEEVLLYRADDPALLAWQVKRLFDDDALCARLSAAARARANRTHDANKNVTAQVAVYEQIISDCPRVP
ncbi:MAG: glycosyltransferase [Gammaproteobacteria bacterium]|nr:glycosyltransferase [Gammaproteobacteria bacterium]